MGHSWLTREAVGSAMHLHLLGPFEMVVDSGPVRLAGRGERALVTVLALSAGRVVADTTLIEQLWSDGDQPVDPVNALQTRVSKVRRALAAAGSGELLIPAGRRVPPGCGPGRRRRAPLHRVDRPGSPRRGRGRGDPPV